MNQKINCTMCRIINELPENLHKCKELKKCKICSNIEEQIVKNIIDKHPNVSDISFITNLFQYCYNRVK